MEQKFLVTEEFNLDRIDRYLAGLTEHSRSTIQALMKQGNVLVNGELVKNNYKIKTDDEIVVTPFEVVEVDVEAEDLPITIVYQDKDVVIIDKANGMVVHPAVGNPSGTLVNALLFHIKDLEAIKGEIRPGIVHRIDKETSGLLMVAKNAHATEDLGNQLREKTVTRKYIALVEGNIPHKLGKITAPIGRDPKNRQKMACVENGKHSVTHFKVLRRYEAHTLIECTLETGRTHQIRVHMNYIDHPLVGDPKYGRRKTNTENGQFLHAKILGFEHPTTKEYMEFTAELPEYFTNFLNELE